MFDALNEKMYVAVENAYDALTIMSYQKFKKVRRATKVVRNLSIIANMITFIMGAIYNSKIPFGTYEPEIDPWIVSLNGFQYMVVIGLIIILDISAILHSHMSHAETIKLSYKAWCEEHDYVPFND